MQNYDYCTYTCMIVKTHYTFAYTILHVILICYHVLYQDIFGEVTYAARISVLGLAFALTRLLW